MSLKQIDLNLFLVFDAIYTQRNITRAAEVLCITQPAASNALSRLRSSLNDPLFVRTPKGMAPTPLANSMVHQVREALKLFNACVHMGDTFNPLTADNTFHVSMNDVAETLLLPQILAKLQEQAPRVSLTSYRLPRKDLQKELASGQLSLAVDIPGIVHPDLVSRPLNSSPYVCLVRPDHPEVGDRLTLDQYLELGHVHISSRRYGAGHVDRALSEMGLKRNIQLRMQYYLVVPSLLNRSNLALTAPLQFAEGTELKILDLPFEVPKQEWSLYWHRSADQDQASTWFRQLIIDCFSQTS